ncbi:VC2046/SO_2500 family protein [Catenovulum sp. SX2]|uniref:VC2046/SO_2500 family protein n=1 Tax=Catenovulum sp. SX2 TaxID=3398614 RepID=UPI003F86A8AE
MQIINEGHISNSLNRALEQNHRGDFALLLAMLDENVCENAQFKIAKQQQQAFESDEAYLKQQLGVVHQYKVAADDAAFESALDQSYALNFAGLAMNKLVACLNPPALSQFNDKAKVDQHVIDNLSLHARNRLFALQQAADEQQPTQTDPTLLYDILQAV